MRKNRFMGFVLACLALLVPATRVSAATLADLLGGGSITVGDEQFFGFHGFASVATGAADPVSAASIFVNGYSDHGLYALDLQSAKFNVVGGTQETTFDYWIETLSPSLCLNNATISATAAGSKGGTAHVTETIRTDDAPAGQQLASLIASTSDGSDSAGLVPHPTLAHVQTDVYIDGGVSGNVLVSDFTQSFGTTSVPMPMAAWMGLVLLGGLALRKRRRVG